MQENGLTIWTWTNKKCLFSVAKHTAAVCTNEYDPCGHRRGWMGQTALLLAHWDGMACQGRYYWLPHNASDIWTEEDSGSVVAGSLSWFILYWKCTVYPPFFQYIYIYILPYLCIICPSVLGMGIYLQQCQKDPLSFLICFAAMWGGCTTADCN